jgi:hypothetical protein
MEEALAGFPIGRWRTRPGKPDFHHRRLLCAHASSTFATMKFGIDRLLAEPALRAPLAASAWPCSPIRPR